MEAEFKVLAGSSMSGKTYKLCSDVLKEAYENPLTDFIFVVPDQAGNAYEKKLIEMNSKLYDRPGFMNIDVLGFNRLAFRIFEDLGVRDTSVLEEYEKNMLIRIAADEVKGELEVYGNSIDKNGFISQMKSLLSEFIQYDISPEDLEKLIKDSEQLNRNTFLSLKLKDINKIYQSFLKLLEGKESGISEDRLKTIIRLLKSDKKCSITDNTVFIFDEYRGYTPDQLGVIEALRKRASKMIFSICINPDIIRKNIEVKEHDIFHQSYMTLRQIQECMGFKPEIIFCDQGDYINPDQRHLESNIFRFPVKDYKGRVEHITVSEAAGPEKEIRVIAQKIRDYVKSGYRYKDIVIVSSDLENFDVLSSGIFDEYHIPLFCDYSRKLRKNPYTDAIVRMLEVVDRDFDYDSVFGFLKSGAVPDADLDYDSLENFILKTGIRGKKMWSKPFINLSRKTTPEQEEEFKKLNQCREELIRIFEPFNELYSGKHKGEDFIDAIYKVMDYLDFEDSMKKSAEVLSTLGMRADSRIMEGLYRIIDRILSQTKEFLGEVEFSLHDFSEIVKSGIEEIKVGVIPPTLDSVTACDPDRSRIIDTKILFFAGMNDGKVPTQSKKGGILSDKDKEELSSELTRLIDGKRLSDSAYQQSIDELFLLYQILSKPTDYLHMSYSATDNEGNGLEPSYILGRIARLFPELEKDFWELTPVSGTRESDRLDIVSEMRDALEDIQGTEDEGYRTPDFEKKVRDIAAYKKFGGELGSDIMEGLLFSNRCQTIPQDIMKDIEIRMSVSRLEKYMSCPYSFFMKYILGVQKRDEKKIEYYDVGNMLHDALEKTMKEIKDKHSNDWAETDDQELKSIMGGFLNKAWDEYVAGYMLEEETGKLNQVKNNLMRLSDTTIVQLKEHIKSGKMLPMMMEQEFSATFNAKRPDATSVPITIRGKIDRLDSYEEDGKFYIRVIDYKTGSTEFSPEKIKAGTAIQLSAYTEIIAQILAKKINDKELIPAGLYYYHVSDPCVSDISESGLDETTGLEEAAEVKRSQKLILSGVSNDDDNRLYLNLHDKTLVDKDTGLMKSESLVIPVSIDKKGNYKSAAIVSDTEGIDNICEYSLQKMKKGTEAILSGDFSKNPTGFGGRSNACTYCDYASVCRFNEYAGKQKVIKKLTGKMVDKIKAIEPDEEKIELDNCHLINRDTEGTQIAELE
ncbi:MAG: PD-(D/E)XK nuclease family protein [Eubacterium sp.]|nr:PD-(D/E)XK nuclease family protein [Eubacterium sp.]